MNYLCHCEGSESRSKSLAIKIIHCYKMNDSMKSGCWTCCLREFMQTIIVSWMWSLIAFCLLSGETKFQGTPIWMNAVVLRLLTTHDCINWLPRNLAHTHSQDFSPIEEWSFGTLIYCDALLWRKKLVGKSASLVNPLYCWRTHCSHENFCIRIIQIRHLTVILLCSNFLTHFSR